MVIPLNEISDIHQAILNLLQQQKSSDHKMEKIVIMQTHLLRLMVRFSLYNFWK